MAVARKHNRRRWIVPLAAAAVAVVALVAAVVMATRGSAPDQPSPLRKAGGHRTSAPASARQPREAPRGWSERVLSNERTWSRWAHVTSATVARQAPDPRAKGVVRLATQTSDRTPEVVLALSETTAPPAARWVRVRLPMRPNNRTGWVPRRALGRYYLVTTFLRIDLRRLTATLRDKGRIVWQAPVAVGQSSSPTPAGRFYVRSRILPLDTSGPYGAFAFGTSAYSPGLSDWPGGGVVGLHGTNRPELIPGRVSHGCVRIRNRNIARLRRLMPLGTPIEVI